VEAIDVLIRCDAVPEPTFLWWDVRPQPRFGTVAVCRPHAEALGCAAELDDVIRLGERTGAQRQLEQAATLESLPRLVGLLAADFVPGG
jgi:gamma-glutamyl:cysteine ligase YbdK (ATP-grasp superfamily)